MGCARRFRPRYPDFLSRVATNVRVCGFHQGKPHEPRQSQQGPQEIRSTLWRTWRTRPIPRPQETIFVRIPTLSASNWDLSQHDPEPLCRCRYNLVRLVRLVRTFFQNLGGQGLQGQRAGIDRGG
jgi:hypothetical protein